MFNSEEEIVSQKTHVHIITRPAEQLAENYLIALLGGIWAEQGGRVTVGPCATLTADVGIVHTDCTLVPHEILPDNPYGRPLLNASVLDISKRRVSKYLLTHDSDYVGPVIIKTDANSFGMPELRGYSRWGIKRMRRRATRVLPWWLLRTLGAGNYPVLPDIASVPGWVWRRDDLVVERFIPEMEGDEYSLRIWMFFGDREYSVRLFGYSPVVKVATITRHEYLDEVPDYLRQVRKEMGMDFGKFDYVMSNGEVVLLDVNKTPTLAAKAMRSPRLMELAQGLDSFLDTEAGL